MDKFEDISFKAYKNADLDGFPKLYEKYAYLQLKELYERYRYGDFDKEKSIKIKNKIKREYEQNEKDYLEAQSVLFEKAENYKKNTSLSIQIDKSNDKDEILYAALKIVSNCLSDQALIERVEQKFK